MATAAIDHLPTNMKSLADLTLIVGPQKVRLNAVREILKVESAIFRSLLASNDGTELYLPDDNPVFIEVILSILHDDDDELEVRINHWEMLDLFHLAKSTRKYGVSNYIAHLLEHPFTEDLPWTISDLNDRARALFVACTFNIEDEVSKILTELILEANIEDKDYWRWLDPQLPTHPHLLDFKRPRNMLENGEIQMLDVDSCCGEMRAFVLRQHEVMLDATLHFSRIFVVHLREYGIPEIFESYSFDQRLEMRYIEQIENNLTAVVGTGLNPTIPNHLRCLSPLQLYARIFRVNVSSWPEAKRLTSEDQKRVNCAMTWPWYDFVERTEGKIKEIAGRQWQGHCGEGLVEWFDETLKWFD